MYFSDPGKITGIEKSSKSYEHGSDRIEPPGIESSFDSFVCGHSSRRNKRRDNRIRFSTSLSHVESATIEADILFDIFPPMRQDNSTNQEFCKSANLLSSDWVFIQLKRGIWTCFNSSGEKSSDASRRRWKRSSQTASYAQRNQCMKVISDTNRKTDLRQNIQPKTESRSMKISPESHKYKPRPNKNKSTTIIGLYILQWYPVMKTSHARKCPFMPIRHRNTRGIAEIFATDEDAHDISPFNGGNSDGIYGAVGFLYHMQIIPNWK